MVQQRQQQRSLLLPSSMGTAVAVVETSNTANTTKENHKGSTRSYYYNRHERKARTIAVGFVLILTIAVSRIVRIEIGATNPTTTTTTSTTTTTDDQRSRRKEVGTVLPPPPPPRGGGGGGGRLLLDGVPLHPIDLGVNDAPVVMIRSALDDDVLGRFREERPYSSGERELNGIPELDNRVEPPVHVYEGYYHSLPHTSGTVYSKNPNPMIGRDFDKPAAPPFTRAFFEAVRTVNRDVFETLAERLREASATASATTADGTERERQHRDGTARDVSHLLSEWIRTGRHFGDLSVQIHYGESNRDKLDSGRAWHTDAANSLLHLAVTIRGRRTLHSKRRRRRRDGGGGFSSSGNTNTTTTESVALRSRNQPTSPNRQQQQRIEEEEKEKIVLEPQRPGSVYLSSSTLMTHAPEFFETSHEDRSIAIHARLLYTSEEVDRFYRVRTPESWTTMTRVLAETLSIADLRLPNLAEVESTMVRLQTQPRPQKQRIVPSVGRDHRTREGG